MDNWFLCILKDNSLIKWVVLAFKYARLCSFFANICSSNLFRLVSVIYCSALRKRDCIHQFSFTLESFSGAREHTICNSTLENLSLLPLFRQQSSDCQTWPWVFESVKYQKPPRLAGSFLLVCSKYKVTVPSAVALSHSSTWFLMFLMRCNRCRGQWQLSSWCTPDVACLSFFPSVYHWCVLPKTANKLLIKPCIVNLTV